MANGSKILILYHSGTGNTKFACDVARMALERAGDEVAMETYAKAGGVSLDAFDACCFASPVYEWAPARNVERFVKAMPGLPGGYAFIVTSSAGAAGQATNLLARWLGAKGLTVLGDHNLICPDSWGGTRRWSHVRDSEVPTLGSVLELVAFAEQMSVMIRDLRSGGHVDAPAYRVAPTGLFWASRLSRLAPGPGVKMGRKKVDVRACSECGVCEKNCPAGAIRLEPYPVFDRSCIACWRCINTCPEDCITTVLDSGRHYKGIPRRDELLHAAGLGPAPGRGKSSQPPDAD